MQREIEYGQWQLVRDRVAKFWSRLTEAEVRQLDGSFESLAHKVQRRYGLRPRDAAEQVSHFLDYFEPPTRH